MKDKLIAKTEIELDKELLLLAGFDIHNKNELALELDGMFYDMLPSFVTNVDIIGIKGKVE